ncbi:hypothetical protein [Rubricoccus marinus]|uniref:Uncharacterized protein n=1 Tax=Rubricoccus marinus TaxID=716817 RepID=A0A259TWT4_9BACT|nr:hypothetical protein [Rubricoccus marinus]OZC02229.1 hypothetical protein BSZ36_04035 [Rubricoccus marinus]
MESNFVVGGAVAALLIIAGIGVWLLRASSGIRDGLVPYVGETPARWLVGFAWTGYVLGVLQALATAVQTIPAFAPETSPSAVQFITGLATGPILGFASWVSTFVQIGALLVAVVVVSRVLRSELR